MRALSKISPDWWDYTTLDREILDEAAKITIENLKSFERPGFKINIYDTLQEFYAGTFPGGQIVTLDASQGGVGLPLVDETWRFNAFTKEDYDALFEKLASGEIQVPMDTDYETADQIPVTMFTVEIV